MTDLHVGGGKRDELFVHTLGNAGKQGATTGHDYIAVTGLECEKAEFNGEEDSEVVCSQIRLHLHFTLRYLREM